MLTEQSERETHGTKLSWLARNMEVQRHKTKWAACLKPGVRAHEQELAIRETTKTNVLILLLNLT